MPCHDFKHKPKSILPNRNPPKLYRLFKACESPVGVFHCIQYCQSYGLGLQLMSYIENHVTKSDTTMTNTKAVIIPEKSKFAWVLEDFK